jgi:hypothetical protein
MRLQDTDLGDLRHEVLALWSALVTELGGRYGEDDSGIIAQCGHRGVEQTARFE